MGLEESKVTNSKLTKSKSNLADKVTYSQDLSDFITELSTMACLQTTRSSTFQYVSFQKLPFKGHFAALPLCNKISLRSDSVFICYDCSIDKQTAYLCQECFEKGHHDTHRFSVFPNNNSWGINFCRCGDEEYLKKKVICETHLEAPIIKNQVLDKKQISKFSSYFHQGFKILFGLMQKNRASQFMNALFSYLQKMTDNNLYFSKITCQFLLQINKYDGEGSNLSKFIRMSGMANFQWDKVFRNLSFAKEYKIPLLRQFINGINQNHQKSSNSLYQLIINFSGKLEILNSLAKNENLTLGVLGKQNTKNRNSQFSSYYELLIKRGKQNTEIWKCLVRNQVLEKYVTNDNIMKSIIKSLVDDEEYITLILEQLLKIQINLQQSRYILQCLMILVPEYFIPSLGNKKLKSGKSCVDRLQKQFISFYNRIFLKLNTLSNNQQFSEDLILILPYFSFGQTILSQLWQELEKRVQVVTKNKQKEVIKQASQNIFNFITKFLIAFMTWDHKVLRDATEFQLLLFTKDAKLIEKVLIEYFDKNAKLPRLEMLLNVDSYTQKQRNLAQGVIKSHLRYNARKGKYYNISKVLPNNPYDYEEINIENPLKFTQWQQFISKRFFTENFFRLVPRLIKITQKALMDDIELVKKVSNISVCLCLLNKNQKKMIKQVTRNFIKQIPDVKQQIYYVLTRIRDRLELDVQDLEESGKKGTKKVKLDLITQIRDKKYKEIKQRQNKIRLKYLKQAQKLQSDQQQQNEQNFCHICKEKSTDKRRFIYPCNFTRNNIVSTLLKSDVTDLDINICLHKVHEDCFEKQKKKGECFICKFQANCYIPETPLADESYTKNWLRKFENIVTNINMQSGKSFNSDWATIFLTYLIYSKSFKVIMKNTEIQDRQRSKADDLIFMHYKSQLQKWPQLTKQAIKKADKTVKGQVTRQSNLKKVVKTLVFDLVLQQISGQPMKNSKRVQKKFRELINIVGTSNAQKINEGFAWSRDNAAVSQIFDSNVSEEVDQLFKIRQLPDNATDYLAKSSIKCPMCSKYQPTAWECLFCSKISCHNCINPFNHCLTDHKGSAIILSLSDAKYSFFHDNRNGETDSLYRNQFQEGWVRSENPEGWQAKTQQIYTFFDTILHSQNPFKRNNQYEDDSDNQGFNNNRGWAGQNNAQISQSEDNQAQEKHHDVKDEGNESQQDDQDDDDEQEEQVIPKKAKPYNRFSSSNKKRR